MFDILQLTKHKKLNFLEKIILVILNFMITIRITKIFNKNKKFKYEIIINIH